MSLKGKKLLVMGGSMATYAIVKNAQEMGVYVVVADAKDTGEAYKLADEGVLVSTIDMEGLAKVIKEKEIDGVFCGPSEFNILNTMKLCEMTGLRFYANRELWDKCGDKEQLKSYCKKNGLPCIPEYHFESDEDIENCPDDIFPVIVKPVDGCSSKGVTVCRGKNELKKAHADALEFSASGRVIVEKYMDNGGRLFSFRYILDEGEAHPYMLMDTYIADPKNKKSLISAFSLIPSELGEHYMQTTDAGVRAMLCDMGLKNGTVFAQSLPCDGDFYVHDMGYRLSGGMMYKVSETLTGINDMKMMIRYALGESICTEEDKANFNPTPKGCVIGQLMIPVNAGTVASVKGFDGIESEEGVIQFIQYYHEGDTVAESVIGTLGQQFARISIKAPDKETLVKTVNKIQDRIAITDTEGREMYTMRFDTQRLYK